MSNGRSLINVGYLLSMDQQPSIDGITITTEYKNSNELDFWNNTDLGSTGQLHIEQCLNHK